MASDHFAVLGRDFRRCHVQQQGRSAADPERGPPRLKGGRSRQFPPLPGAVGHEGPIEISELVQRSRPMRAEQSEIRKGHQIDPHDLVEGADLVQGPLDVLGGFGSSQLDVRCEHLPNVGLRKTRELQSPTPDPGGPRA